MSFTMSLRDIVREANALFEVRDLQGHSLFTWVRTYQKLWLHAGVDTYTYER